MAEITKKRRGELVRGVFSILRDCPEGLAASEVLSTLETVVAPTPFEQTYYEKRHARRYEKIVRFSTITAVKAGWLVKEKGQWRLTEDGLAAYDKYPDPEQFEDQARRLYKEWKKNQPPEEIDDLDRPDVDEPSTTLEEAEEAAWNEIRSYLGAMPPYEFQELVGALLKALGYRVDWISPPGADGGIDIVAYSDQLGLSGPRIKVQVKRKTGAKIGADDLRSFLAVLGDQDAGVFVCTSGFTSEAQREARSQEKRRIILIDDTRLVELWIERYGSLDDVDRQHLPLRPIYFLAPGD